MKTHAVVRTHALTGALTTGTARLARPGLHAAQAVQEIRFNLAFCKLVVQAAEAHEASAFAAAASPNQYQALLMRKQPGLEHVPVDGLTTLCQYYGVLPPQGAAAIPPELATTAAVAEAGGLSVEHAVPGSLPRSAPTDAAPCQPRAATTAAAADAPHLSLAAVAAPQPSSNGQETSPQEAASTVGAAPRRLLECRLSAAPVGGKAERRPASVAHRHTHAGCRPFECRPSAVPVGGEEERALLAAAHRRVDALFLSSDSDDAAAGGEGGRALLAAAHRQVDALFLSSDSDDGGACAGAEAPGAAVDSNATAAGGRSAAGDACAGAEAPGTAVDSDAAGAVKGAHSCAKPPGAAAAAVADLSLIHI